MRHDQISFIPGMKGFFTTWKLINVIHHTSTTEKKTKQLYDHLTWVIKFFDKIQKPLSKQEIDRNFLNLLKDIYE